jgi:hypothetical protein
MNVVPLAVIILVILLLFYYYPLSAVITIPLTGLLYMASNKTLNYSGGDWLCDTSKEYQDRCFYDENQYGYNTKQICENSCLTEEEKYPSVENVLKFTENINFSIPKDFLLSIDQNPNEYHKFIQDNMYDLVSDMINFNGLREQVSNDIIELASKKGIKINVERMEFSVVRSGGKYNGKLLNRMLKILKENPDSELFHQYKTYLDYEYKSGEEFNIVWPNIAKDIGLKDEIIFAEYQNIIKPLGFDMTLINVGINGDFNHATFLLIDHKNMKAMYFDSNINMIKPVYDKLKNMLQEYVFTNPLAEGCPIGLQGAENKDMSDKYCQTWSLFVQHLYIMNYGKPIQEFLGYLLTIQKHALDILFVYSFYLYTKYKNSIIGTEKVTIFMVLESEINVITIHKKMLRKLLQTTLNEGMRDYIFFLMGLSDVLIQIFSDILDKKTHETLAISEKLVPFIDLYGKECKNIKNIILKGENLNFNQQIMKWEDLQKTIPQYLYEYIQEYVQEFRKKIIESKKISTCTLF